MTDALHTAALPPWLDAQLAELNRQRGHALLLAGPAGLGQYPLALALARRWLCEQPQAHRACGHCASCHAVDVRAHPDLCVLMPETLALALGWPLDEKTQERIDRKEVKPSKAIRVDAVRQAVAFTQFTRARSDTQVVLVYPAERLNMEAANTLLKTLEEPTGAVRFVLATEAAHSLLPTIRSRCQSHAMAWPDAAVLERWLHEQLPQATAAQRQLALQAAGGRPDEALQWAAEPQLAQLWPGLPAALARGDWTALADWPPARQMDVLLKLCHDLMVVRSGATPRFFPAAALPPAPSWSALLAWRADLQSASRTLEHPFAAALMQEAWAQRARTALAIH
jgi:DNA polymerase III subunit delta'